MKIDPLFITLCGKASKLGRKIKKEKDPDKKLLMMEAQLKLLRMAELLQYSMNGWVALILIPLLA